MHFKRVLVLALVVFAMLMVLAFGTLDYDISKGLINTSSVFAEFFNRFGETPMTLAFLISTAILFGARRKEKKINNLISHIVALPFMALFSFATAMMPIRYAYEHAEGGIPTVMMVIGLLTALVIFFGTLYVIRRIGPEKLRQYRRVALVLLMVSIGATVLVNVVKILWARPRMRSIDSIEQFKYWYQINGPSGDNELKSFPSGHTANSFIMLAYLLFIPLSKKDLRIRFSAFAILWGAMTALSRVILGAHFLSDVIVGGFITILLIYIFESIFLLKRTTAEDTGR